VNALLAALTSLLIVIFAALFAAPYLVDWNEYRTVFEAQASKLAGRSVRVAGDVDLTILPVPEVRFSNVSIADDGGGFEAPSATARAFRMTLSIPPLLRGKVEARKIELDRLSLRLGLDEAGQVEWPRIGEAAAALPFMPANVSLKSVTLNEASLSVARPGQPARWRVEGLSGELSAETLRGPFKFAGRASIGEQMRDLQLSLGRMTGAGKMPVKAVSAGKDVVYRAEGSLEDRAEGPLFTGQIEATPPRPPEASPAQPPKWQARAGARATLDGASLDDLSVSITRKQRPQTMSGDARLTWGDGLRLDADLKSQWLDLDLLAGSEVAGRTPAEVLLALPSLLADVPVPARSARIEMRVAQISLGGDLIRDVHAVTRRGDRGWGVEKLEGGLPGGSGFGFEGDFKRRAGAPVLSGAVHLSGSNLDRLLQWASPGSFEAGEEAAKRFSISGEVQSAASSFDVSDISARLGASRFGGSLHLTRGDTRSGRIELDASKLDLRPYIGGDGTAETVSSLLGTEGDLGWLGEGAWRVAIDARRLVLPEFTAIDATAALKLDNQAITIETLGLRGPGGLHLAGSGVYPRAPETVQPSFRLTLRADSAERVREVVNVIPRGGDHVSPHLARLRAAAPLALTASLRPSRVEDGFWLRVNGRAGNTDLSANARFYGSGRQHVSLAAENPSLSALASQIAPRLADWLSHEDAPAGARLRADFAGASGEALTGQATLETKAARLSFAGSAAPDTLRLDGQVTLDAPDANRAFQLVGLPAAGDGGPLRLDAAISGEGSIYSASDVRLDVAGLAAAGSARLDVSGGVPAAEVNLKAARFNLANAATLLLKKRGATSEGAWSDVPFANDALGRIDGSLSLVAEKLVIAERLTLRDATMMARLEDGGLHIPMLAGELYGGPAMASARLSPSRGRMVFKGEATVSGLGLAKLPVGDGGPLASGEAEFSLSAESQGLSPRGLMTVMSGSGEVSVTDGTINGLNPDVLANTARSYLRAEGEPETAIAAQLEEPLRNSKLRHGGARAELRLQDGALRVPRTQILAAEDGQRVTASARIDLVEAMLNSRWEVAAALDDVPLPAVRVSFDGPLSAFGKLDPEIDADDLQQFLTVARVERNVERLEQLRRERDRIEPLPEDSAPAQGSGGAGASQTGPQRPDSPASEDLPLETSDPLPGFSTQIEDAPEDEDPAGTSDAPADPAAARSTPSAALDEAQAVEDARREIMREERRRPQPPEDRFYEIFQN